MAPMYVGGANACPLEDVGGPWGYADFLETMADPAHPKHGDKLEWWGGGFDPAAILSFKAALALDLRNCSGPTIYEIDCVLSSLSRYVCFHFRDANR